MASLPLHTALSLHLINGQQIAAFFYCITEEQKRNQLTEVESIQVGFTQQQCVKLGNESYLSRDTFFIYHQLVACWSCAHCGLWSCVALFKSNLMTLSFLQIYASGNGKGVSEKGEERGKERGEGRARKFTKN